MKVLDSSLSRCPNCSSVKLSNFLQSCFVNAGGFRFKPLNVYHHFLLHLKKRNSGQVVLIGVVNQFVITVSGLAKGCCSFSICLK